MGHLSERALDGSEALAKLETANPDLVLLDYQMPGINGIEVLKEIRRRDNHLPVIMITAYGTIERAVEAVKAGADDFITKPFDPEHLALVVKKALATSPATIRSGIPHPGTQRSISTRLRKK